MIAVLFLYGNQHHYSPIITDCNRLKPREDKIGFIAIPLFL